MGQRDVCIEGTWCVKEGIDVYLVGRGAVYCAIKCTCPEHIFEQGGEVLTVPDIDHLAEKT